MPLLSEAGQAIRLSAGGLTKKALPYCGACRRYVLTPAHKLLLAAIALAALLLLLILFETS